MFKDYESKPITRQAYQIQPNDRIQAVVKQFAKTGEYTVRGITFKAHEEVKVGDWIVRLTEDDTYHCTDAVFRERNIVED